MNEMEHLIREVADLRHAVERLTDATELSGRLLDGLADQQKRYTETFKAGMEVLLKERELMAVLEALLERMSQPRQVM